jgi:hypothetical protein
MKHEATTHSQLDPLIESMIVAPNKDDFFEIEGVIELLKDEATTPEAKARKSVAHLLATCFAAACIDSPDQLRQQLSVVSESLEQLDPKSLLREQITFRINTEVSGRIATSFSKESPKSEYAKPSYWQIPTGSKELGS